jgi:DNA-binding transcriptional LysR family regulator
MDKIRHMRALITVAKLGSLSAAAKTLGVTPGMMSKQIKHLEDVLNVRLLHRTTRGVSLTDAGELYVSRVDDILRSIDEVEAAVSMLAAGPRGLLRVNCPPSFGTHVLTQVIAAFARDNPELRVELGLQDDEPDVIASRLDLIFRLGKLRDSSLVAKHVGDAPFVLCAAPAYIERFGAPDRLVDLANFNCIIDASIQFDGIWELRHANSKVAQQVTGNFSSLSTEAVIEAAIEGLGIAYVPQYAVTEELEHAEVIELQLRDAEPVTLPLYALYGSRDHVAAKVRIFLDFYEDYATKHAHLPGIAGVYLVQGTVPRTSVPRAFSTA